MAKHNISYQFQSSIETGFRMHVDKHALKHTGETSGKVFSFREKDSLLQVGFQMRDYLKANSPEIRYVKDIRSEHWQSFLKIKSSSCSRSTLENYVSRIGKLQDLVNRRFNLCVNWRDEIYAPVSQKSEGIQRIQSMDPTDYALIGGYGDKSKSKGVRAVEMAARYGLRSNELSGLKKTDIKLNEGTVHVLGKGGKERIISVRPMDMPFLQETLSKAPKGEKVFGIRADSINKYLNRAMKAVNVKDKYPETSIHSIRKMAAQRYWDELRSQGYSKAETAQLVSQWLGHGRNRGDIIVIYVRDRK